MESMNKRNLDVIYPCRFRRDDFTKLQDRAAACDLSTAQFIRLVLRLMVKRKIVLPLGTATEVYSDQG
jgi:hypothetical protein